jgi:NTP pyrophosphatase (non-canonical NTP hydrolase)
MSDDRATVSELRRLVNNFVDRRDWHQFHSPKNLAMSLAIETGELMEHFQWISTDESRRVNEQPEQMANIADELADVFCYVLALANELNIDLSGAVLQKMAKNEEKYPADRFYGRAK